MQINKEALMEKYQHGPERCGFIVNGEIIEVINTSHNPDEGFVISVEDVLKYSDIAEATWHTHPEENSNLSGEDYAMFTMWKDLYHIIIGSDGLKTYKFSKEKKSVMVVNNE